MYIVAYMHIFATVAQSGNDYSASVSINILFDMDVDIWHEICSWNVYENVMNVNEMERICLHGWKKSNK